MKNNIYLVKIGALVALIIAFGCLIVACGQNSVQEEIDTREEVYDGQYEGEFFSYDKSYLMRVKTTKQDNISYVDIAIYQGDTSEAVFSIPNEYRAQDFMWITWEMQSNNFWIKSGDLGTFCYVLENGNWTKYTLAKENDRYYLVKGMGANAVKQEVDLATKIPCDAG